MTAETTNDRSGKNNAIPMHVSINIKVDVPCSINLSIHLPRREWMFDSIDILLE